MQRCISVVVLEPHDFLVYLTLLTLLRYLECVRDR